MKPVDDEVLDELEGAISPAVKAIRAYLAYQGDHPGYRDRARVAIGLVGAFARVRASESNRMQVELISHRLGGSQPKELPSWHDEPRPDAPTSASTNASGERTPN